MNFFFFAYFCNPLSSRHENRCQMLVRLFCLFQCSRNPQCTASGNEPYKYYVYSTARKTFAKVKMQPKFLHGTKNWCILWDHSVDPCSLLICILRSNFEGGKKIFFWLKTQKKNWVYTTNPLFSGWITRKKSEFAEPLFCHPQNHF